MTATPTPTTTGSPQETWLNRVQGLLAKAESTEFPEEAEALLAKAQELMSRHAIDEAMLAAVGQGTDDAVTTEVLVIEAPYASAKAALLGAVARSNQCRMVRCAGPKGTQHCTVVGHEADLANVRALFSSLSLHAVRGMLTAPVPPYDTPRRFRHAFLLAFAARIGERLRAAEQAARRQAEQDRGDRGGPGVGVVLADRQRAVDAALQEAFPRLRTTTIRSSSGAGWASGRAAADGAGLGHRGVGGSRRGLHGG